MTHHQGEHHQSQRGHSASRDGAAETSGRALPAHIANLLARQSSTADGRAGDSAGIPWDGRDLSGDGNPLHTFDGDDGRITRQVAAARDGLLDGALDEAGFVNALRGERLFVPVIATVADQGQAHDGAPAGDKEADIALVSITSASGRSTMPAFTSVEALTAWHPEARPVAAEAERVMLAALGESAELVVVDPGAELTFVLRRPAVVALAQGAPWTPSYQCPQVASALEGIVGQCLGVTRLVMAPGKGVGTVTASGDPVSGGGSGPELSIGVVLEPGLDAVDARLALASVQASLEHLEVLAERADSVEVVLARESG
ncbi:SseB family protein [Nesterenkonia suensis]